MMRWLLTRLGLYPWMTTQLFVASFFINLMGLASALYVMQVYGRYLTHGIDETLLTLSSGMLIVIVLELALRRIRYRMALAMTAKPEREAGFRLFDTLLHARADAVMHMRPGARQMLLGRNEQYQNATNPALLVSIVDVPFLVIYVAAIFFISVMIGWFVLVLLLALAAIALVLGFSQRRNTQGLVKAQAAQAEVSVSADRYEMVRNTGAAGVLQAKWDERSDETRGWKFRVGRDQDLQQNLIQTMSVLATVVVISLGAREVVAGNLDFGMLIGLNILATRSLMMLARPAQAIAPLLQATQHKQAVDEFLETPVEPVQGTKLPDFKGELEFKNVGFAYNPTSGPVVQQLNLKVPAGSFVKVIGQNGSGKTTLARLLSNLFSPRQGAILADGVDVRQLHPQWWREQLVYLPQEPQFMDGTLRENLCILRPDVTDEQLNSIIEKSGLKTFVDHSEDGLEMAVVDGGRQFSMGIRRRIALARAMVADGKIIVIDEPVEGLDGDGVKMIGQLLNEYSQQGRTIIVMMHDQNTIQGKSIVIDLNSKPVPKISGLEVVAA